MKIQSALTATALAALLVLGTDYLSFAATGGSFLLGKSNTAGATTTLTNNGAGPVLSLRTSKPTSRPPLGVNSSVKVAKLNADLVDGKSAGELGVRTRLYETSVDVTAVGGFSGVLAAVPAGTYLATMNAWIYGPLDSPLECWLNVPATGRYLETYLPGNSQGFQVIGQSGVLRLPATGPVQFSCSGPAGDYTTFGGQPLQVSLTRVDVLNTKPLTVARPLHSRTGAAR